VSKLSSRNINQYLSDASQFVAKGQFIDAETALKKILDAFPNHPEALSNIATIYFMQNKPEEAIVYTKKSLKINPYQSQALRNCALGLRSLGRLEEALAMSKEAMKLQSNHLEGYVTTSLILSEMDKDEEALFYLNEAIKIINKNSDSTAMQAMIYNNRASLLIKQKKFTIALDDVNQSLTLKSDFIEALQNKAVILRDLSQYEKSLQILDILIQRETNLLGTHFYLKGSIYQRLAKLDLAIESFNSAITHNFVGWAEAKAAIGWCQLYKQNFIDGWKNYEYRVFIKTHKLYNKKLEIESWQQLNKIDSILLLREQGIGDEIFFCGFLDELSKKCKDLTVEADSRLIGMFKRSFQGIHFIESASQLSDTNFDKKIPLGSIAQFFRRSVSDFKNTITGYLKIDPFKVDQLKKNIQFKNKIKIGISWRTRNKDNGNLRTIDFDKFISIFDDQEISIINLQYGDVSEEVKLFNKIHRRSEFINHKDIDNFHDMDGLACLIDICDVVITIGNATNHLAGALGKETWVLLPIYSDFRWFENSADCLWYPNTTLFRQESVESWDPVIDNIKETLQEFMKKKIS
jgi:tetratricopeptide (TPR) repeat protein